MNRVISAIAASVFATIIGLVSVVSSNAAPVTPTQVQVTSNIEQAQYRERREDRRHNDRYDRRDDHRRHVESRGRPGFWNGHRGYRDQRRGYRRGHDGWWYPAQAFGGRIIIRP